MKAMESGYLSPNSDCRRALCKESHPRNVLIQMMKSLITIICTHLASLALVAADGLSVKDGKLTRPHSVFELSPSQKEEIETLNTVTLTNTQWAELREHSPGSPKRLDGLLPITWSDCLCCNRCAGVILNDGRIAVLHQPLSVFRLKQRIRSRDGQQFELMANAAGEFFLDGVNVDVETLVTSIRESFELSELSEEKRARAEQGAFDTRAKVRCNGRLTRESRMPLRQKVRNCDVPILSEWQLLRTLSLRPGDIWRTDDTALH